MQVSSIAVCAGSGSSVLKGVEADVYITGEMSHHEVLDAVSCRRTVILCEHSNTERGYLLKLRWVMSTFTLSKRLDKLLSNFWKFITMKYVSNCKIWHKDGDDE